MHSNDRAEISYQTLIPQLLKSLPEFRPDESDVRDGITYMIFAGLVDFILSCDPNKDSNLIHRAFAFLDRMSQSQDNEIQMLLRDVAWAMAEHHNLADFKSLIPPRLLRFIKESPSGNSLT